MPAQKNPFSLCSAGTVVWWDIGANFLNYLSICTASSDDPLRAHRTRVKLRLERNFVNSYFTIKYPNSATVFQSFKIYMGSCFKILSPGKCFNPNRINFGHVCHEPGGKGVSDIVQDYCFCQQITISNMKEKLNSE